MALNLHRLYAHPSLTDGRTNGLAFSEFRNSEWRGKIGRTEIPHNSSNGRLDNDLILVCYYFIYLFCLFIPWFMYSSILSFIGYHHCPSISVLLAVLKLAPIAFSHSCGVSIVVRQIGTDGFIRCSVRMAGWLLARLTISNPSSLPF